MFIVYESDVMLASCEFFGDLHWSSPLHSYEKGRAGYRMAAEYVAEHWSMVVYRDVHFLIHYDVLPRAVRYDVLPRIARYDVLPRMARYDVLPSVIYYEISLCAFYLGVE